MQRTLFLGVLCLAFLPSAPAVADPEPIPPPTLPTPVLASPPAPAAPNPDVTMVAAPPTPPACVEPPSSHVHDGFYFRIAEGLGYASITGNGRSGRTDISGDGAGSTLLIGGTPARGFVVGGGFHVIGADGALDGGPLQSSHVSGSAGTLGPFIDWYPDTRDGWHLGLLAGLGATTVTDRSTNESAIGVSGTLLGGYDWWIGPEWSLGLLAAATAATAGALKDGNQNDTGYRGAPLSFALEASLLFH